MRDWKTANDLFATRHFDTCLFFCHLTLEKILKALVIKTTGKPAPFTHDLAKLARLAGLSLDSRKFAQLRTITTFNIAARYDEVKLAFYKKCTPAFTREYLSITRQLYQWFKREFRQK